MKLIRTEDAVGQVLCHDITQIIPGQFKGARFRKGHIVQPEDIPVLLSIGKENLYVWEKRPGILHEDEAAALLYKAAAGRNIHGTEPKEGKIELVADCDGLLKIDRAALLAVNRTPQMMIATIHGDLPVKKGQKLAGTRIIPLVIEQEKMDAMQAAAGSEPILNVLPFHPGTHDNTTLTDWWENAATGKEKANAAAYLHLTPCKPTAKEVAAVKPDAARIALLRAALGSVADRAIIPMPDWLGLGAEAHLNTPGKLGGNWTWRAAEGFDAEPLASRIQAECEVYCRAKEPVKKGAKTSI